MAKSKKSPVKKSSTVAKSTAGKAGPKGDKKAKKPVAKLAVKKTAGKADSKAASKGKKPVTPKKDKKAEIKAKVATKPPAAKTNLKKSEGSSKSGASSKMEKETKAAVGKAEAKVPAPAKKSEKPSAKSKVEESKAVEVTEEAKGDDEVVLTDADGRRYCRVKDCDQIAAVDGYCRYHYLLFWKRIQVRKKILSEGKLERYIEELTSRYPDKYLEMLRKDLRNEKDFMSAIQELEIDESSVDSEFEDETQSYLDEVRGIGSEASTSDSEEF